ncbi:hypothetical protein F5146DRAFT_892766, partial [Armillaria mellea]
HNKKRCLVTYLNVNGLNTLTLWDSGSTSTAMSPPFADVSKALVFRLINPIVLQLGTVGSRSRINFGTKSKIMSESYTGPSYFDVVNIDKYDVRPKLHMIQDLGLGLQLSHVRTITGE